MKREMMPEWAGFTDGKWVQEINLRDFIQRNYKPYEGDKDFLAGPTQATTDLWNQVLELSKQERENLSLSHTHTHTHRHSNTPEVLEMRKENPIARGGTWSQYYSFIINSNHRRLVVIKRTHDLYKSCAFL